MNQAKNVQKVFYEKAENFVAYVGVYKLMQRT